MDFKIEHTWDGFPVKHEPVFVRLNPGDKGVMMEVNAPFFNDPPAPLGEPGKPFNELWNYEVVEAFFLNDITEQYLEVELCPQPWTAFGTFTLWKKKCVETRTCFIIQSVQKRDKLGRQSLSSLELFSTKCDKIQFICNSWIKRWKKLWSSLPCTSAWIATRTKTWFPSSGILQAFQF